MSGIRIPRPSAPTPRPCQPLIGTADERVVLRRASRSYEAYGVCIRSHLPLSCLPGTERVLADVELVDGRDALFAQACREARAKADPTGWFCHRQLGDGSDYLRWNGLFEFLVSADGRRIACFPSNGNSRETFQTYLVSQVLSFALLKQGIEPLHATVVVWNGRAVAFLGDCGSGKSSLGAAFLRAGHRLLTDDLLVIREHDESGQGFLAYPGPPRIKLFPKIAASLFSNRFTGVPLNPRTRKQVIPLNPFQSSHGPVPLRAMYVLRPPSRRRHSNRITIRRLCQPRAMLQLITHTFNRMIVDPGRLSRQFDQAGRLTRTIPIKSLSYPRTLSRLQAVLEAIQSDLAS